MLAIEKRFYKQRVALNVLANSPENAKAVFQAAEGHVLIGVRSKDYQTIDNAIAAMQAYGEAIDGTISIGLGAGDNKQASVVAEIVKHYACDHINQVFPAVGATRANLGERNSWINSLVSPTEDPNLVKISTGAISATIEEQAIVPIKSAIALIRDMGGNAIKFFPMKGLTTVEAYKAVAKACGEEDFGLEPTGGINKENFNTILEIALAANVPKIIPHVYSSIISKQTGETNIEDIYALTDIMKKLVDTYD